LDNRVEMSDESTRHKVRRQLRVKSASAYCSPCVDGIFIVRPLYYKETLGELDCQRLRRVAHVPNSNASMPEHASTILLFVFSVGILFGFNKSLVEVCDVFPPSET